MTAHEKDRDLQTRIERRCHVVISLADARALRRAALTLQRWHEGQCGADCWCIERDEQTQKPYRAHYPDSGPSWREPIADREAGALRTVADVCSRHGLSYYQQTDPRGCALYVSVEPLTDQNYSGVGVGCDI